MTEALLSTYRQRPRQTLLLQGPDMALLSRLSLSLALDLLKVDEEKAINNGWLISLPGSAPIEEVRKLIDKLSRTAEKRVVILNEIDSYGQESQNALLKTLEQSPPYTYFILSAGNNGQILPTVMSRAELVKVPALTKTEAARYFKHYPPEEINKAWAISEGRPSLMEAILEGETVASSIDLAKEFLRLTAYERLLYLEQKSFTKTELAEFLSALRTVLKAVTISSIQKDRHANINRLVSSRKTLVDLSRMLQANSNQKLINLALVTELKV